MVLLHCFGIPTVIELESLGEVLICAMCSLYCSPSGTQTVLLGDLDFLLHNLRDPPVADVMAWERGLQGDFATPLPSEIIYND